MGLAKQRAKKKPLTEAQQMHRQEVGKMIQADQAQSKGMQDKMMAWKQLQEDKGAMLQVPEVYDTGQGTDMENRLHVPVMVTQKEMEKLAKDAGHEGIETPYGVKAFPPPGKKAGKKRNRREEQRRQRGTGINRKSKMGNVSRGGGWSHGGPGSKEGALANSPGRTYTGKGGAGSDRGRRGGYGGGGGGGPRPGENAEQYHQRMSGGGGGGGGGGFGAFGSIGLSPEEIEKRRKAKAKEKWEADRKAATEKHEGGRLGRERERHTKGVMRDAQGRTAEDRGVMTDASGKKEGEEGFDFETATMKGGFDESTAKMDTSGSYEGYKGEYKELGDKLGGYQSKFDTMAGEARAAGDKGATAMEGIGEQYKGITGDAIAAEAKKGQTGFEEGAEKIGGLETGTKDIMGRQAGYESQIAGMADKVASGEAGQSQAAMLQGQMEQQRMAGQKGSEEKLRREMAQSGASPAEIAAKVAQFQRQSASDQSMASRSEALSSQLQGQQMGQAQMGAAAGLMGQALGATGQQMQGQAQLQSQGAQQAALRGQAAGMGMQGAQAQQTAQLQSLQGQGAAIQSAAGMAGQGIQQQASMYGQGMGALQAKGGMVGEQAGMTQAQLNDVIAQQTEQFAASEAEKQRKANAAASAGGGGGGGGGILGGVTRALGISDIRLKENIELLEEGKGGDPNIYSFNYKWQPKHRWSGVMAQELLGTKHADSVRKHSDGYYMVDYHKLGIQMKLLS